jgi:hypothetical protein
VRCCGSKGGHVMNYMVLYMMKWKERTLWLEGRKVGGVFRLDETRFQVFAFSRSGVEIRFTMPSLRNT